MPRALFVALAVVCLSLPAAAAPNRTEAALPAWLTDPSALHAVACGRSALDLAAVQPIEPEVGPPVNTSDPNCICPSPVGAGWKFLNDDCKYHPETALCDGHCYWDNARLHIGTRTPCGSP